MAVLGWCDPPGTESGRVCACPVGREALDFSSVCLHPCPWKLSTPHGRTTQRKQRGRLLIMEALLPSPWKSNYFQ